MTHTTDDLGHFNVQVTSGQLYQISASGYYRNEITGELSTGALTLRSIYKATDQSSQITNVNLLTHIASDRVLQLIGQSQTPYETAIKQAESELSQTLSGIIPNQSDQPFYSLSIFGTSGENSSAYLLTLSTLFYQYAIDKSAIDISSPDAELSLVLNEFESDFHTDGSIDDTATKTALKIFSPR